jgi:hypothetical protein
MSMTTHVIGFRPPDEHWQRMKAAWDACESAGATIPNAVLEFFDHVNPGDAPGAEVALPGAVTEYKSESQQGYEIDVRKLPPSVHIIRVVNSY